jgi:hypothetical protein
VERAAAAHDRADAEGGIVPLVRHIGAPGTAAAGARRFLTWLGDLPAGPVIVAVVAGYYGVFVAIAAVLR